VKGMVAQRGWDSSLMQSCAEEGFNNVS
jgi:hypothetical protein